MNRKLQRIIHLDLSRSLYGEENLQNCLFLIDQNGEERSLFEIVDHIVDIIEKGFVSFKNFSSLLIRKMTEEEKFLSSFSKTASRTFIWITRKQIWITRRNMITCECSLCLNLFIKRISYENLWKTQTMYEQICKNQNFQLMNVSRDTVTRICLSMIFFLFLRSIEL